MKAKLFKVNRHCITERAGADEMPPYTRTFPGRPEGEGAADLANRTSDVTLADVALHVDLHAGGTFSGKSAYAWDLDEEQLEERFLKSRRSGEEVWLQGEGFDWTESKIKIYEGPNTSDIPDFTSALGPAAYAMGGQFEEVTDRFITGPPGGTATVAEVPGDAVFVVHGQDIARREEVARFLSQVLAPDSPVVVLHEEANRGRTLIEKFEGSAADAQFAVVLLTADDEARARGSSNWERRARQNVVFELGFFVGKLGRARVAVLYESGVERPSDIDGLAYIALDEAGAWKLQLGRELKAAGLDADLNRLMRT